MLAGTIERGAVPARGVHERLGRIGYQPALDGLRGLAVLAVLLFHAGHLRGGFLGVDLFFTLSGFLITTLLLAEHAAAGQVSLRHFWSRRARRLLPALYVVLAATVAYAVLFARTDSLQQIRGDAIAALAYVANWRTIATGGDYWSSYAAPSPLQHLWSLAVEEQFYILWPLIVVGLIALAARRGASSRRLLLGATAVLATLSAVWMAVLSGRGAAPTRMYIGTDTRAASILVGALAAIALAGRRSTGRAQPRWLRPAGTVVAVLAGVGLLVAWSRIDGSSSVALYRGGFVLHAVAVVAVIVVVTTWPSGAPARAVGVPPLRLIGLISYGLYLWHWPVYLVLTPARTGLSDWPLTGLRAAVAILLATVSYLLVERPIRAGALRAPTLRVVTPVTVAAIVAGVIVATVPPGPVVVSGPVALPTTVPASTSVDATSPPAAAPAPGAETGGAATATTAAPSTAAPTTAVAPSLLRTVPAVSPTSPVLVRTPTQDDRLRVLLFGDSYMYDASPGMAAALDATGLVDPTQSGLFGFTLTKGPWQVTLHDQLKDHRPELVVAMWARFDAAWMAEHGRDAYEPKLREAIGMMVDEGATVAIVGLAPSQTSGIDTSPVGLEINEVFASMVTAFPGKVVYLDPDPIVAPDGVPRLSIDTPAGPVRVRKADLSHFCPDGSARFGMALTTLLGDVAAVPVPDPGVWAYGDWRADGRFNDPPGACS
jgi:peptidoglycan/LPS O-acetylase OafA/YrhL